MLITDKSKVFDIYLFQSSSGMNEVHNVSSVN